MWLDSGEEESEDKEDDDDDDEFDNPRPEPGSLQALLDTIENERNEAYTEAFNAYVKEKSIVSGSEINRLRDDISKPFEKRADAAREETVKAGTMTADEAKSIKGVNEEDRKAKRKIKRNFQEKLNEIQRERNAAVHDALNKDGPRSMSTTERLARIAKAEKPFLEKMEKAKEAVVKYTRLTEEDVKSMVPNIVLDDDGQEIPSPAQLRKEAARLRKEAGEEAFVPPRMVTSEGFPVTKAGMKKCFEIRQEVDKRDPDMHAMYSKCSPSSLLLAWIATRGMRHG